MQRFIVERNGQLPIARHTGAHISYARSFSMGGSTFDVYIAADRRRFHSFVREAGIPFSHVHG